MTWDVPRRQICACGEGCNDRSAIKWEGILIADCIPDDDAEELAERLKALVYAGNSARRLSTAVDRLEGESLKIIEALGLHEDTAHDEVLAHVRALVKEHAERRMVVEGHRHRFRPKSNHHPKCDIPLSCQGGCWDLFYGDDPAGHAGARPLTAAPPLSADLSRVVTPYTRPGETG